MESSPTALVPHLAPEVHVPAARMRARDWLLFHLKIGLFGFGHGAVMPMFERALVRDTQTMTPAAFNEALTVALLLPGPSLITLSMHLGRQHFGTAVGLLGLLAMCVPGALWALLIVTAIPIHHASVRALFRGFTIGALVLLAAMVVRLESGLRAPDDARPRLRHLARICIAAGVCALLLAHVPMVQVVGVGVLACLALEFLA
ncbi:MAG: chromate transporter [Polyangiales bacterium]